MQQHVETLETATFAPHTAIYKAFRMLKKGSPLRKIWPSRSKSKSKKKESKALQQNAPESPVFQEITLAPDAGSANQENYETKFQEMRDELEASFHEQLAGQQKREASTVTRLNAKITTIAKQRDEMKDKLLVTEKKYRNLKKMFGEASENPRVCENPREGSDNGGERAVMSGKVQEVYGCFRNEKSGIDGAVRRENPIAGDGSKYKMSSNESSSGSSNEAQPKKVRKVDGHARSESVVERRDLRPGTSPGVEGVAEKGMDVAGLYRWIRDTNRIVHDMQRCLTEIKSEFHGMSDKFEKFTGMAENGNAQKQQQQQEQQPEQQQQQQQQQHQQRQQQQQEQQEQHQQQQQVKPQQQEQQQQEPQQEQKQEQQQQQQQQQKQEQQQQQHQKQEQQEQQHQKQEQQEQQHQKQEQQEQQHQKQEQQEQQHQKQEQQEQAQQQQEQQQQQQQQQDQQEQDPQQQEQEQEQEQRPQQEISSFCTIPVCSSVAQSKIELLDQMTQHLSDTHDTPQHSPESVRLNEECSPKMEENIEEIERDFDRENEEPSFDKVDGSLGSARSSGEQCEIKNMTICESVHKQARKLQYTLQDFLESLDGLYGGAIQTDPNRRNVASCDVTSEQTYQDEKFQGNTKKYEAVSQGGQNASDLCPVKFVLQCESHCLSNQETFNRYSIPVKELYNTTARVESTRLDACKCACHLNDLRSLDGVDGAGISSGYMSEDTSSGCARTGTPRWDKTSVLECVKACRRVGDWGLTGNDYVQRHIVTSSAVIAALRDLKPQEV